MVQTSFNPSNVAASPGSNSLVGTVGTELQSVPTVSIITAARNAGHTLDRMFASVAQQTMREWQHIVVVNGCTDETETIVRRHAATDRRIEILCVDAETAGAARNAALGQARADHVLFLDADDTIAPRHLAALHARARTSRAAAVASGYRRLTADGREMTRHMPPRDLAQDVQLLAEGPLTALHAILFERRALEAVGGFDAGLRTNEDWDLCRRVAQSGGSFALGYFRTADYWTSAGSLTCDAETMVRDAEIVASRFGQAGNQMSAHSDAGDLVDPVNHIIRAVLWNGAASIARNTDTQAVVAALRRRSPFPPAAIDPVTATDALLDGLLVGFGCKYSELEKRMGEGSPSAWTRLEAFLREVAEASADTGLDQALLRGLEAEMARIGPAWPQRMIGQSLVKPISGSGSPAGSPAQTVVRVPFIRPRSLASLRIAPEVLSKSGIVPTLGGRLLAWASERQAHGTSLAAMRDRAARGFVLGRRVAMRIAGRHAGTGTPVEQSVEDLQGDNAWEEIFSNEDPWNYHRVYEQTKYDRTIGLLPQRHFGRALELACAEGLFTERLAPRVDRLTAADISITALERAERHCAGAGLDNISYQQLDFFDKPIGSDWDLIVSSEVLYYMGSADAVSAFAKRVADALAPDGLFLHAHAYEVSDSPERSGFDWGDKFAVATISKAFSNEPGLILERAIDTELYRIELYRKAGSGENSNSAAVIEKQSALDGLEPELAADVVWNGAIVTREAAEAERHTRVPVLMYHRIGTGGPEGLAPYQVSPQDFEHQLRFLRRRGYRSINLEEWDVARSRSGALGGRPVLITFDDGCRDFADTAWPILKRNGFGAHVFVVTGKVGGTADWDAAYGDPAPLMDWDTIRTLVDEGVTLGSHMHRHLALDRMSYADVLAEASLSRELILNETGVEVSSIAPPYGICDAAREELIMQAGYRWLFRAEGGQAPVVGTRRRVPRIDVAGNTSIADFARMVGAREAPEDADLP